MGAVKFLAKYLVTVQTRTNHERNKIPGRKIDWKFGEHRPEIHLEFCSSQHRTADRERDAQHGAAHAGQKSEPVNSI